MITINLLDYRRIAREIAIQKQLTGAFSLVILFVVFCGMSWLYETTRMGMLEEEIAEVQLQVDELTPEYKAVQAMRKRHKKLNTIIVGINNLRNKRGRTTEILEDVGQSLPEDVWLETLVQKTSADMINKKIPFATLDGDKKPKSGKAQDGGDQYFMLTGTGKSDPSIVHFLERLRVLPYLDEVVLTQTGRKWIGQETARSFTLYFHVINPEPKKKK